MNQELALLDVRQMAEADRLTIAAGISGFQLMENVGRAVAEEICRRWTARPVVILCGPGNNGGDGFVVARLLTDVGWSVRVALLGPRDRLKGDAELHAQLWQGSVEPLEPGVLDGAQLAVDAIFGAGLNRPLEGPAEETLAATSHRKLPIVAVDVASGVNGDTGESLGAVGAALTVTFFRRKPGHLLSPGRSLCGDVVVADIGIPPAVLERIAPNTFECDPQLWAKAFNRCDEPSKTTQESQVMCLDDAELHQQFGMTGDRLSMARAAASRTGRIVVLHGSETVVASPDGRAVIHAGQLPATFGSASREVLAGMMSE
jgi:hydroxyethylthiazole kinase-like uncharacterized protein yjeF